MNKTIHLDKDFMVVNFTSKITKNDLYIILHLKNSKTKQEDMY